MAESSTVRQQPSPWPVNGAARRGAGAFLPLMLAVLATLTPPSARAQKPPAPEPLTIGDTWSLASAVLGETRRVNVYAPPGALDIADTRLPVLYMPDGGLAEDFLHVAGLVQVGAMNGTMRPFLLVGIENTERRRDLTGPTDDPEDLKIAPRVGRSAEFRSFLRDELMPFIDAHYPTSGETAIVGESLAGLFAVETFLLEPGLFDTVIAIDPSLWWNRGDLVTRSGALLRARPWRLGATIWLATGDEGGIAVPVAAFADSLSTFTGGADAPGLRWLCRRLPDERHLTIYHPAALRAFREVLGQR
ncbi:MAG: alpha/beta hydrolase [bacterium]|nr:alpha/beta hydrolase [bacterium]